MRRVRWFLTRCFAALTLPVWIASIGACARGQDEPPKRQILVEGIEDERARLQEARDRDPASIDARVALGEAHYRTAREALDLDRDEERYLIFLSRSVDEFLAAVELDASDGRPHFYLALMDVYRGEIEKALRGFRNALKLSPSGVAHTNLAEIFVYMGRIEEARSRNASGQRLGAPLGAVWLNEMLIAWRTGDLDEARRIFARIQNLYPESIQTINVARLPHPPDSFEGFARYCCRSPACGPYLVDACRSLGIEVEDRALSASAALRRLQIEIEATRRLREIYRQRKELEIEIEGASPDAAEGTPPP